ncbi:MAG: AEC family transporter [Rhodospirillales bacterium]
MAHLFSALLPVFAVIVLGHVIKRTGAIPATFWQPAEQITFFVFFPALLVVNTARADLGGLQVLPMVAALFLAIGVVVAGSFALRPRLGLDGPSFTSLIQAGIRPNVYLAIAAATALFGAEGLTAISLCIAFSVPLVNVISVVAMIRYASPERTAIGWRSMSAQVVKNPLIIACTLGLLLNITGVGLPPLVGPLLDIVGRAALPIGLLAVGAGLDLRAIAPAGRTVATAATLKLLALPVLTWLFCLGLGVHETTTAVAVLYASMPNSATAYVMARQMGGNAEMLAGSITATTLAAAITVPLMLTLFG